MTCRATVISASGNIAVVETERFSACEGCDKNTEGNCSACTLMGGGKKKARTNALNRIGAVPGDIVTVESSSNRMMLYAFLIFVLPIVAGLGAYYVSLRFLSESWSLIIGVLAMFICMTCVVLYSKWVERNRTDCVITEIIRN